VQSVARFCFPVLEPLRTKMDKYVRPEQLLPLWSSADLLSSGLPLSVVLNLCVFSLAWLLFSDPYARLTLLPIERHFPSCSRKATALAALATADESCPVERASGCRSASAC
jgi:hypothetical protein